MLNPLLLSPKGDKKRKNGTLALVALSLLLGHSGPATKSPYAWLQTSQENSAFRITASQRDLFGVRAWDKICSVMRI